MPGPRPASAPNSEIRSPRSLGVSGSSPSVGSVDSGTRERRRQRHPSPQPRRGRGMLRESRRPGRGPGAGCRPGGARRRRRRRRARGTRRSSGEAWPRRFLVEDRFHAASIASHGPGLPIVGPSFPRRFLGGLSRIASRRLIAESGRYRTALSETLFPAARGVSVAPPHPALVEGRPLPWERTAVQRRGEGIGTRSAIVSALMIPGRAALSSLERRSQSSPSASITAAPRIACLLVLLAGNHPTLRQSAYATLVPM